MFPQNSELTISPDTNTFSSHLTGARLKDFLFGKFILFNAALAISIIFLIFIYVGKEAIPVFYDPDTRKEASLSNLFAPQNYGTEESPLHFVWQPVGDVPKVQCSATFPGDPQGYDHCLALWRAAGDCGGHLHCGVRQPSGARNRQAGRRVAGRHSLCRFGVPGSAGAWPLGFRIYLTSTTV